jgi:hypothetical protein
MRSRPRYWGESAFGSLIYVLNIDAWYWLIVEIRQRSQGQLTPSTPPLAQPRPFGGLRKADHCVSAKELIRSKAVDQTAKPLSVSMSEKHFAMPTKFTALDPTGDNRCCNAPHRHIHLDAP